MRTCARKERAQLEASINRSVEQRTEAKDVIPSARRECQEV
jgi:hypothetical protein